MGRLEKKGVKGAAANYITRAQAIKRLQCSLADFRRLCILSGIYPREPKSRKKANKGSTAHATFYYVKDIQYLLHEPVLEKLREHKAFAKKLSRALGRQQYGLVKNLDDQKPVYKLDHIIKERYPTFVDSLRDLDDALSLIVLFAHLPASEHVPASIIANCARLFAEWQLYIVQSHALRKVFLSIKGIYYQAHIKGQTITWLVPYQFTPHVPSDVDFRIMLTFLELYQTLLGFIFFKLYSDANLIYPPKVDQAKDGEAAGLAAYHLQETNTRLAIEAPPTDDVAAAPKITAKDVKKQIKSIVNAPSTQDMEVDVQPQSAGTTVEDEDQTALFANQHFYLSREVTRPFLEFIIRSFSGQVSWDPVLGQGSPALINDARITHHVVDRPMPTDPAALGALLSERASYAGKRTFVQPQWVVDCVNAGRILPTGPYAPSELLPPHLSPFVDDKRVREEGGYVPREALAANGLENAAIEESDSSEEEEIFEEDEEEEWIPAGSDDDEAAVTKASTDKLAPALQRAAQDPTNAAYREAAELEAETQGITSAEFEARLQKAIKNATPTDKKRTVVEEPMDTDLNTVMISTNKKRKLYKSLKIKEQKQAAEKANLEAKKKALGKKRKAAA